MADRGIIFSAPMVQTLLAGRKTQTRRLATSPLRRCEVGDRLWVRENWAHTGQGVWDISAARMLGPSGAIYMADGRTAGASYFPSIHMPREFSRITLTVTEVRFPWLQQLSDDDALDEGIEQHGRFYGLADWDWDDAETTASGAFRRLWNSLHDKPGERWEDNPLLVALTFEVSLCNIDHRPS